MRDSVKYGLNSVVIICGLLIIYIGTIEPFNYISILIVVGGLALTLMGIMSITTLMKLNEKLREGEARP